MVRDVIGVAVLIVIVAGISAAIVRAEGTAKVITAFGDEFVKAVKAASLSG